VVTPFTEIEVFSADDTHSRLVGTLRPSFMGGRALAGSSFQYDSTWIRDGYELSPELPLTTQRTYTPENKALFGVFADAAPDEWGRKIIDADFVRRRKLDPALPRDPGDYDFLLGVSDLTRMGALRFRDAAEGTWCTEGEYVANLHELPRVLRAAQRYEADEASDEDIEYLSEIATAPGGARPKANVVLDDGALALAKLPHSKDGSIDVEAWEVVALDLARQVGIVTPEYSLRRANESKSVLVSHRFDRTKDGRRIPYLSAATVLDVGTAGSRPLSYEDFADAVGEFSADPAADLEQLYRRVAFTVLVNNTDDHWRNHGFLRGAAGWRLSPVFDVNPSPRRGTLLSRPISRDDDPRDRDIRNLLVTSRAYGLSEAVGSRIIAEVATAVVGWSSAATERGIPSNQQSTMAPAFDPDRLALARQAR
jgi:serine/threonine-protein kinase HipA